MSVYFSDVSGAFDKVSLRRLVAKLENKGVRGPLLSLVSSWLEERDAVVAVDGFFSVKKKLLNMVYQDAVLGPPL